MRAASLDPKTGFIPQKFETCPVWGAERYTAPLTTTKNYIWKNSPFAWNEACSPRVRLCEVTDLCHSELYFDDPMAYRAFDVRIYILFSLIAGVA